jgi:hypothetical protein
LRFDEGFRTRPRGGEEPLGASGTTGEPNRRGVDGDSAPAVSRNGSPKFSHKFTEMRSLNRQV